MESQFAVGSLRRLRIAALVVVGLLVQFVAVTTATAESPEAPVAAAPVRFVVGGDFGSADERQYDIGAQIAAEHYRGAIDMILTTGENIYPDGSPSRFASAFERPFAPVTITSISA